MIAFPTGYEDTNNRRGIDVGPLNGMSDRRAAKEVEPVKVSAESVLNELCALVATIRQCQRNGHPDASKHIEALLGKLES